MLFTRHVWKEEADKRRDKQCIACTMHCEKVANFKFCLQWNNWSNEEYSQSHLDSQNFSKCSSQTCPLLTLEKGNSTPFLAAEHWLPADDDFASVHMKLINFRLSICWLMTVLLSLPWADGVSWTRNSLLNICHYDKDPLPFDPLLFVHFIYLQPVRPGSI